MQCYPFSSGDNWGYNCPAAAPVGGDMSYTPCALPGYGAQYCCAQPMPAAMPAPGEVAMAVGEKAVEMGQRVQQVVPKVAEQKAEQAEALVEEGEKLVEAGEQLIEEGEKVGAYVGYYGRPYGWGWRHRRRRHWGRRHGCRYGACPRYGYYPSYGYGYYW